MRNGTTMLALAAALLACAAALSSTSAFAKDVRTLLQSAPGTTEGEDLLDLTTLSTSEMAALCLQSFGSGCTGCYTNGQNGFMLWCAGCSDGYIQNQIEATCDFDGYDYCSVASNEEPLCQNCLASGGCSSGDGSGPTTKGSECTYPRQAGGAADIALCPTSDSTSNSSQIWEAALKVDQVQADSSVVRVPVGKVVVWQGVDGGFEAIALLECPWMIWSSAAPLGNTEGHDENNALTIAYKVPGNDTFFEESIPFTRTDSEGNPFLGSDYYTCAEYGMEQVTLATRGNSHILTAETGNGNGGDADPNANRKLASAQENNDFDWQEWKRFAKGGGYGAPKGNNYKAPDVSKCQDIDVLIIKLGLDVNRIFSRDDNNDECVPDNDPSNPTNDVAGGPGQSVRATTDALDASDDSNVIEVPPPSPTIATPPMPPGIPPPLSPPSPPSSPFSPPLSPGEVEATGSTPAPAPFLGCNCSALPEAVNGECGAGQTKVLFEYAGEETHVRCSGPMSIQSTGIYSYGICWNPDCLPTRSSEPTIHIPDLNIPGTGALSGSTATMVTFLTKDCTRPTVQPADATEAQLAGREDNSFLLPPYVGALNIKMNTSTTCDDGKFLALASSTLYDAEDQPIVPPSSEDCYPAAVSAPEGPVCEGITIPVVLETTPDSYNIGQTYAQCINPANFDFYTYTATVSNLTRYNIRRMPGGVKYISTLKAPPGVKIAVYGTPKASNEQEVAFGHDDPQNGTYSMGGDWLTTNITLPSQGFSSMKFVWTIPPSSDDRSAAVTMEIAPGQVLPAQPPAPPGTVCACPEPMAANGTCVDDSTVLASITRTVDGQTLETKQCLVAPNYDVYTKAFWFSTCWRWSCLDPAFRGPNIDQIKPYNISVLGIDKFNLDRMPGGTASVELRKPIEVAAHVKAYGTKSNGNGNGNGNGNQVSTPLISEDGTIELPATVTAFDVLLEISADPWIENTAAAVIITPGPFPPSPPQLPTQPPLPPTPIIDLGVSTNVVLDTSIITASEITTAADLEQYLRRKAANIEAAIDGYVLGIPVGFTDYSTMSDCSPLSIAAKEETIAALMGVTVDKVTVACRFSGSPTVVRRRRSMLAGRDLMQAPGSLCPGQTIDLSVELDLATSDVTSGLAGKTSEAHQKMSSEFGSDTCLGSSVSVTKLSLSQRKAALATTDAQCSALRDSINVSPTDQIEDACEERSFQLEGTSSVELEGPSSGSGSGSSSGASDDKVALGVGLGVGLGGGLILIAVAVFVIKKKSALNCVKDHYAEEKLPGPNTPKQTVKISAADRILHGV